MIMKKTVFIAAFLAVTAFTVSEGHSGGKKVLYMFESPVCVVCKRAKKELQGISSAKITIKYFQVLNKKGRQDAAAKRNIRKLKSKLKKIKKKMGKRPFVYEAGTGKAYPYKLYNKVPHYLKRISASTVLKKEMGVPIFILDNDVFVGYNNYVKREIFKRLK